MIGLPVRRTSVPSLAASLDDYFQITERGSTLQTELRSGCIAWMTMSYIMVVNPVILSKASSPGHEVDTSSVMMATAFSAAIGSLAVGIFGKAPLGLMPGMGLNAYFAFGICHNFHVTWGQALTCCFVSGALLLLLALAGVCNWIVTKVLSDHLKKAITVAIGVFQALIGFQVMGLVVSSPDTLVTLGDIAPSNVLLWLALIGFCLISVMLVGRLHGALLLGIWAMALCAWSLGLQEWPDRFFSLPRFDSAFLLDFSAWSPSHGKLTGMIMGTLVMLFVALFDLAGVQYGLMGIAGLLESGTVPRSTAIFSSAALATMAGAVLGTSPIIIANESSAGIIEGARTGLSAIVVAVLFLLSAFISPLLSAIPHVATAVPLVLIGAFMMAPCRGIDWDDLRAAIPSFLTVTVVPFTYSIHNGIIAGILMDIFLTATLCKRTNKEEDAASEHAELLLSKSSRHSSPEKLYASPHAMMSAAPMDEDRQVEKARQFLLELRLRRPNATGNAAEMLMPSKDEALIQALEGYLEGK